MRLYGGVGSSNPCPESSYPTNLGQDLATNKRIALVSDDFTHAQDNATERKRAQDSAIDVGIYRRIYKHGRSNHDLKDAYRRVHKTS